MHEFDPALELKYNKFYIGLAKDGQPYNFVVFRPRKSTLMLTIRVPQSAETQSKLESSGLESLGFDKREGGFRIRLGVDDIGKSTALLRELIQMAYQTRAG